MKELEQSVHLALREAGIPDAMHLLVAVSGGPDSMALLRCLAHLRTPAGAALSACVVDHGIRPREQVEADIALVAAACARLDLPLVVKTIPAGQCEALARARHRSLEETARGLRHGLLREAARETSAEAVALGHTEDDLIETLLMRVLQGSDAEGLSGIAMRRGPFVRPLLHCTRDGVIAYLESEGQEWRADSTNEDFRFYRNRVRHGLIPVLRDLFPGHRAGLRAFSAKQAMTAGLVRELADRMPWRPEGRGFSIAVDDYFRTSAAVRARSLLDLYDKIRGPLSPRVLPWRFLRPALGPVSDSESCLLRGHGVLLSRRSGRLYWEDDIASRCKKGYFIEVSEAGTIAFQGGGMSLSAARNLEIAVAGMAGVFLRSGAVDPPLVLRSKRRGDRILLENGTTAVNDLIAGWKIPREARESVPVLVDRRGVLAVLGGALGYPTRARAGAFAEDGGGVDRMVGRLEKAAEKRIGRGT